MAKVIAGMTISLDGFVADQNGNAGRLYSDLAALRNTAYMEDAIEQVQSSWEEGHSRWGIRR